MQFHNFLIKQLIREGFFSDQEAEAELRSGIREILVYISDMFKIQDTTCIHELVGNNEFNTSVKMIVGLLLQEFKARSSAQYFLGEIFHETFSIDRARAIEEKLVLELQQYITWKICEIQMNVQINDHHIQTAIELIKKISDMHKASMFFSAREKFIERQMFKRIREELLAGKIDINAIGRVAYYGFLISQFNSWDIDYQYIDNDLY